LALFNKAMRKIHTFLKTQQQKSVEATMPRIQEVSPRGLSVNSELPLESYSPHSAAPNNRALLESTT